MHMHSLLYTTDILQCMSEGFRPMADKNLMMVHTSPLEYVCNIFIIIACIILQFAAKKWQCYLLTDITFSDGTTKGHLFLYKFYSHFLTFTLI